MRSVVLLSYHENPKKALAIVNSPIPQPQDDEVLVRIKAASINPIDARMRAGYGRVIFSKKANLPITLGRDFSGTIEALGASVKNYSLGDTVFGVVNPFRPEGIKHGSHAEFTCVPISDLIPKPTQLDHTEAASLPYVALTTYSALITKTGLKCEDYQGKKVLVHAGAGGVGSYAIQFLKALGAEVVTTCSTKNIAFVKQLGVDQVVDYTQENYVETVSNCDIVYDLLGQAHTKPSLTTLKSAPPDSKLSEAINELAKGTIAELKMANETMNIREIIADFDESIAKLLPSASQYVSIVSPMMPLTDKKGLHKGMYEFASLTMAQKIAQAMKHGRLFHYAFFQPSRIGLELLSQHIIARKIKPQVGQVFSLTKADKAHLAIDTGHTQGKIVLYCS